MIDTLAVFADQVTNVAREVGIEGKLGGQARVPGAAGIWRDLTDNVNQLAANLTTQVRAIADVATAVTKGDLTRSIAVEAQGEVAALKDNINEMIVNLARPRARIPIRTGSRPTSRSSPACCRGSAICSPFEAAALRTDAAGRRAARHLLYRRLRRRRRSLKLLAGYASSDNGLVQAVQMGQGLVGQCALEKRASW
jgi:HAMP domain-containing protein